MKILIVDDDDAILTIFSTALKKNNFEVITAKDGASGLEMAKNQKPDLILLDQILPDVKGNDLLPKLKQDQATQSIPVAMLSNFGQKEIVEEAMKQGAEDYILKYQIEPEDLVKKINDILKVKKEGIN
ncbi:MAG: response regulator [Patescibacteria group bacterium]|nr:response regulator [Patescibacteria group bacterium]